MEFQVRVCVPLLLEGADSVGRPGRLDPCTVIVIELDHALQEPDEAQALTR